MTYDINQQRDRILAIEMDALKAPFMPLEDFPKVRSLWTCGAGLTKTANPLEDKLYSNRVTHIATGQVQALTGRFKITRDSASDQREGPAP